MWIRADDLRVQVVMCSAHTHIPAWLNFLVEGCPDKKKGRSDGVNEKKTMHTHKKAEQQNNEPFELWNQVFKCELTIQC